MIGRAFALDPNWNAALHEANAIVENVIARALSSATTTCLALRHGSSPEHFSLLTPMHPNSSSRALVS